MAKVKKTPEAKAARREEELLMKIRKLMHAQYETKERIRELERESKEYRRERDELRDLLQYSTRITSYFARHAPHGYF